MWNKRSPAVARSYLFLTGFGEAQTDDAIALARRGGFGTILVSQGSWAQGTGHYAVNRANFPDGVDALARTFAAFRAAGLQAGLHVLPASVHPPDPYITPVPDRRLVTGSVANLASRVDEQDHFIPTAVPPTEFPAEDGGYWGRGAVLRVGDELIRYGKLSLTPPYGFSECERGYLGTQPAAHEQGQPILHLVRSFGYHLVDLDSSLLQEVAAHFGRVANHIGVDMVYLDGTEGLQGEHWYYNAKLQRAFFDVLEQNDLHLQASSFSPYTWHLLARSASADGHDDLKAYLEERSPWFEALERSGMPLEIGWYYAHDPSATPDMYEYVLGATIGYGASFSLQLSVDGAQRHPFIDEILDLASRYEQLRLSGRVPPEMQERLRIRPALSGSLTEEQRASRLDHRREYRLLGTPGDERFQRVIYHPWHDIGPADRRARSWTVRVEEDSVLVGVQVQVLHDASESREATDRLGISDPVIDVGGARFTWKGRLTAGQYLIFWPGEPVRRYGSPLQEADTATEWEHEHRLPAGEYTITFSSAGKQQLPIRVRTTLQPPEAHAVPFEP